jgi:hypothetical protein
MAAYTFPATLPEYVTTSYAENSGVITVVTPMDMGVAKMRRRGVRPSNFDVSFVMDNDQIQTLDNFIKDTIKGTARFDFPHPRTRATIEVRIVPNSDGAYYNITYLGVDHYTISMKLEQLP